MALLYRGAFALALLLSAAVFCYVAYRRARQGATSNFDWIWIAVPPALGAGLFLAL